MSTQISFSPQVHNLVLREAEAMMRDIDGLKGVVVASIDGFDLISVVSGQTDGKRVAAMASSIVAIGEVVSLEAELGATHGMMIQSSGGFAVFQSARHQGWSLLITVIADSRAILGQVNYRAAQLAALLTRQ